MVPGKYDITIHRGGTWSITLTAKNSSDVAINFATAYEDNPTAGAGAIEFKIYPIWDNEAIFTEDPIFELELSDGIEIEGNDLNLVLTIPAATTATLAFNTGKYELKLITGATVPVVDKLLYGDITVTGEVPK